MNDFGLRPLFFIKHLLLWNCRFQDSGEYVNVPVEDIDFEMTDYEIIDGWKIPTAFHFFVDNALIYIDITAKSQDITHQQSIGFFKYWRYHCHATGVLEYSSTIEIIDSIHIMDLTKFW